MGPTQEENSTAYKSITQEMKYYNTRIMADARVPKHTVWSRRDATDARSALWVFDN